MSIMSHHLRRKQSIMSSGHLKFACLFLASVIVSVGSTAHADTIDTHGNICSAFKASDVADIDYLASGVRNINPAPRQVTCAVPRTPLPQGATGRFLISGSNRPHATTSCTLFSYSPLGSLLGSQSFITGATSFNVLLSFARSQLPQFAYVNLVCSLTGNGNSILRGISAVAW